MAPTQPPRIAVILCTSRQPRCNPQIADFVIQTIKSAYASQLSPNTAIARAPFTLHTIDLATLSLPFFDEPDVPSQVRDPSKYAHAHTREWSEEVRSYDAFIFVTPQYNWGYPAVLKNAIDYLYREWKGKAAMVVSYGGHGGGKANAQLRQVLCAVNMLVTKKSIELAFPDKSFLKSAAYGERLGLDGGEEGDGSGAKVWREESKEIVEAFDEMMALAGASSISKTFKSAGTKWDFFKEGLLKKYRSLSPAENATTEKQNAESTEKQ